MRARPRLGRTPPFSRSAARREPPRCVVSTRLGSRRRRRAPLAGAIDARHIGCFRPRNRASKTAAHPLIRRWLAVPFLARLAAVPTMCSVGGRSLVEAARVGRSAACRGGVASVERWPAVGLACAPCGASRNVRFGGARVGLYTNLATCLRWACVDPSWCGSARGRRADDDVIGGVAGVDRWPTEFFPLTGRRRPKNESRNTIHK